MNKLETLKKMDELLEKDEKASHKAFAVRAIAIGIRHLVARSQ